MAVSISGILKDPYGNVARFADIRFVTLQGVSDVIESSSADYRTDNTGAYAIDVELGVFAVYMRFGGNNGAYVNIQKVTVNSDTIATTLGELLAYTEPLTPAEILQVQALVAEAEGYKDDAEAAATASALSETNSAASAAAALVSENNAANSVALLAPVPLNGGVWASGQEFTAYNQYMIFGGEAYSPLPATPLPYTVGATPDLGFVYQIKLNSLQSLSGLDEPSGLDLVYSKGFASVADMKATDSGLALIIDSGDVQAHTGGYYGGWAATMEPSGGAKYILTTLQRVRDSKGDQAWVPDGFGDHYLFGGTDYVATLSRNSDDSVSVLQCGAYNNASNPTETHAGCQSALNRGGKVVAPDGSYYLNDTLSLTVANTEFVGGSKVGCIFGAAPASTSVGTHNSLITVDVQPYNGSISNMRFKTFGAYTGWAITAGASINGFNGFSITMNDLWNDFATSAGGFYRGGMYDCFVNNLQIDVTKVGFFLPDGGNRSIIDGVNANGLFGPLVLSQPTGGSNFSNNMIITNVVASGHVGNASVTGGSLFQINDAAKWKISNIIYNYGNGSFDPAISYNTLARLTNCDIEFSNITMHSNWGVSRGTGFFIDNSTVTIDNFNLTRPSNDVTRLVTPFSINGVVDVDVTGGKIKGGGFNSQVELIGCGGDICFTGTKFLQSTSKSFRAEGATTFNLRVEGCSILDGYYNVAPASNQQLIQVNSTGDIVFNNNTLGLSKAAFDGGLSGTSAIWDIDSTTPATSTENNKYQYFAPQNINDLTNAVIPTTNRQVLVLADEEQTFLPKAINGLVTVSCGDESGVFTVDSVANTSVKISGSTNAVATNTDGNLCVYGAAGIIRITNRLGSTETVTVNFVGA